MKKNFEIEHKKEEVREKIVLEMRRLVGAFKSYVTGTDRSEHPLYRFVEDAYYKDEYHFTKDKHYGCKDDKYYYCFFPKDVHFIYKNSHWCSNIIFYNDEFKCWFVYDKDNKKYVTFEALDTDSQIAFWNMLDCFVDHEYWTSYYI